MSKFEDFLQEIHAEDYVGGGDEMGEAFNDWLENISIDEWISWGDTYAKKLNADLLEACKDSVSLIRGTFPMVNSLKLLERLEQAIAKAKEVK